MEDIKLGVADLGPDFSKENYEQEKIVEPLTVFKGTNWLYSFDGEKWDDARATDENPESDSYSLSELVDIQASSRIDAIEKQLTTGVGPYSLWVSFKNPESKQAKLFKELVQNKINERFPS